MKDVLVLRSCWFLLAAAIIWFLLGAPLFAEEWQDIPHRLGLMTIQLPARMQHILRLWR